MKRLIVYFGSEVVGYLDQGKDAQVTFTYDEYWQERPGATPLSLSMPLTAAVHQNEVVSAYLDNLLPDNDDVRESWARDFQVSARNPFALLRNVGSDVSGAARFLPVDVDPKLDGGVTWLTESDIAAHLRTLRSNGTAWHFAQSGGRFSLAGAQRKVALLYESGRWGLPSGSTPTTHILKPPVPGFVDQHINEHLCICLARELGIVTEKSRIATFGSEEVIVVERFDRWWWQDKLVRIHQEDMCQALGVRSIDKYQNDGGPSVEDIASVFRRNQSATDADQSISRFVEVLIFNWLIMNLDAHSKNYSILLQASQVRLAPLYDVASLLPYVDSGEMNRLKLAMKIGGEYRASRVAARHWRKLAESVEISDQFVIDRATEIAVNLPDAVSDLWKLSDGASFEGETTNRLREALLANSQRCLRRLQD